MMPLTRSPSLARSVFSSSSAGWLVSRAQPLRFGGHGGNGGEVELLTLRTRSVVPTSQETHHQRLLRLQQHAQTSARLAPNYSGRHYAALVQLADGTEGISANVEATRQLTLCDLRLALGAAQNQWVQQQSQQACPPNIPLPSVETIYLVSANLKDDHPVPCADCQEWLASPFCPPQVSVISLEKNEAGAPCIRQRTVQDMLPLYKRPPRPSKSDRPLAQLPVVFSALAQNQAADGEAEPFDLPPLMPLSLMRQAQAAYQANGRLARDSGAPTGVAALCHPSGRIISGARVDWSTRWHVPADLATVAAGLTVRPPAENASDNPFQACVSPVDTIKAVAYYGEEPNLPAITSLGRLARHRGSAQTRILTIEDDTIQVRTIKDFLPELYRDQMRKA